MPRRGLVFFFGQIEDSTTSSRKIGFRHVCERSKSTTTERDDGRERKRRAMGERENPSLAQREP